MIKRLHLVRFKNFEDAELSLGPLTLLVGANASGKSNVREALRFLHGIGLAYTLAEIFGGKVGRAGERQWNGLRGGVGEVSFRKAERFRIEVELELPIVETELRIERSEFKYGIEVVVAYPRVAAEFLHLVEIGTRENIKIMYDSNSSDGPPAQETLEHITAQALEGMTHEFRADRAILGQITGSGFVRAILDSGFLPNGVEPPHAERIVTDALPAEYALSTMRFIELVPEAMCEPSTPGENLLSDRGEHLSSVLQTLCADEQTKSQLIHWVRALTPMDVADFRFIPNVRGEVQFMLVEKDGTTLSAYSASDGTLRVLGLLAVLFAPFPSGLVFLEDIENGLHPSRLRLLVDLLHSRTRETGVQIVATTHSPTLLALLDDELLKHVSLIYRLEGEPSGRIQRILDIPDAARVLASHDRAGLLASGWFENIVEFASVPSEPVKAPLV